jgi:hypothetical protein
MAQAVFDLEQLYRRTFGGRPYTVPGLSPNPEPETGFVIPHRKDNVSQISGSHLATEHMGKEIWLPVKFYDLDAGEFGAPELLLPYAVVKISGKKTIVKTALAERQGTVKELYGIDDYSISIKGFLIDEKNRIWPEAELKTLKKLFEINQAIKLDNALTNIFLDENESRVVVESFDLPEVEGGRKHVRPFSLSLESDSIFVLELD